MGGDLFVKSAKIQVQLMGPFFSFKSDIKNLQGTFFMKQDSSGQLQTPSSQKENCFFAA